MHKRPYDPLKDKKYMSPQMKRYFERLLRQQLEDLNKQKAMLADDFNNEYEQHPDVIDQGAIASQEMNHIATYKHYRQLSQQIEAALRRIRDGYYGYCLETGEEIGVPRLLAIPHTSICVEAQARHERDKKPSSS